MSVGKGVAPLTRAALGDNPVYARVRDALADPTSDEGRLLLAAIEATGPGGGFMYLCDGEWEDLDV